VDIDAEGERYHTTPPVVQDAERRKPRCPCREDPKWRSTPRLQVVHYITLDLNIYDNANNKALH